MSSMLKRTDFPPRLMPSVGILKPSKTTSSSQYKNSQPNQFTLLIIQYVANLVDRPTLRVVEAEVGGHLVEVAAGHQMVVEGALLPLEVEEHRC